MKKLIAFFCAFLCCNMIFAQSFEVPKDYKLVAKEDYAPYEQDIVKCVDWLINTPIDQEQEKRKEANTFLIAWVSGSPTVHIVIDTDKIVNFLDGKNHDLLVVFIGGWVKKTIETNNYQNTVALAKSDTDGMISGNLAGIEAVIEFYNKNKKVLGNNKNIENYIKLQKQGKLKGFIAKNINRK